jgi:hypothetical protein
LAAGAHARAGLAEAAGWLNAPLAQAGHPDSGPRLSAAWPQAPPAVLVPGSPAPILDYGAVDPLEEVTFRLPAGWWRSAELRAEWTGWSPYPMPLRGEELAVSFSLPDGAYRYGYRLDGAPAPDPLRAEALAWGEHGPATPLVLERHTRTLVLANPYPHEVRFAAGGGPSWLSVEPAHARIAPGAQATLRCRLAPSALRGGLDATVTVGAIEGAPGERSLALQAYVHLECTASPPTFIPHGVRLETGGGALVLAGTAWGEGTLAVRLRDLSTWREVARAEAPLEASSPTAELRFALPAGLREARDPRAGWLLDTGARISNRRFFRVRLPLSNATP